MDEELHSRIVEVRPGTTLSQLLKVAGVAQTGGHAKVLVLSGGVIVNGEVETRRGKKVMDRDCVETETEIIHVRIGGR